MSARRLNSWIVCRFTRLALVLSFAVSPLLGDPSLAARLSRMLFLKTEQLGSPTEEEEETQSSQARSSGVRHHRKQGHPRTDPGVQRDQAPLAGSPQRATADRIVLVNPVLRVPLRC